MFKAYGDIFAHRAHLYHRAMELYPHAREEEFGRLLQLADIRPGHVICDIPSGGGYMRSRLPSSVSCVHIETSRAFAEGCRRNGAGDVLLSRLDTFPIKAASIDRIISLAALHHIEDKGRFFREAHRVLKDGGILCIGDVHAHSRVAAFLEGFVHEHNPMGHRGLYIDAGIGPELERQGFQVARASRIPFQWRFESISAMATFCRLLFGTDRATSEDMLDGLRRYLGCAVQDQACALNWELYFVQAIRTPGGRPRSRFSRDGVEGIGGISKLAEPMAHVQAIGRGIGLGIRRLMGPQVRLII
ncbi:MAG: class I SAM-dependent methyltransferase [Nitrospiraceae bacterium]